LPCSIFNISPYKSISSEESEYNIVELIEAIKTDISFAIFGAPERVLNGYDAEDSRRP